LRVLGLGGGDDEQIDHAEEMRGLDLVRELLRIAQHY
jgi:hypothetical protein